MPPKPAPRVCDVWTPAASMLKATAGLAGAPVTFTVPEIEPAASRPGEKLLAREIGTRASAALRLSACPTLPETVAVPPPRLSASLSKLVVPLAMVMVDAWAIAALMPRMVASPEASSIVVVPLAILTRPAALAGMSLTVAPPEKPVQSPSRLRSTSMPRMTVPPEVTLSARIFPEITGAAR
jgi:hypothetical protein